MADKLYDEETQYADPNYLYESEEPAISFGERIDAGNPELDDGAILDDTAVDEAAGEGGILGGAKHKLEDEPTL